MIAIRCLDELDALEPRKAAWNALAARSETHTVYQTYEWHASWWHAFGAGARALVLLAEEDGELAGIAPLALSERRVLGRRRRVVEFMGSRASDYCDLIVDRDRPAARPALVQWLLDHADLWDLLLFANVPNEATVRVLAEYSGRAGFPTDVGFLCHAPSYRNVGPDDSARLLNKRRLSRPYKHLMRQGELTHRIYGSTEELTAELAAFFQQHIERRAQTDAPSKFLDARWQCFYRELARSLGAQRHMLIMATCLDGSPLAYDLCFECDNRLYCYDRCFATDYAKESPGCASLWFMIRYVQERAVEELDFGRGDEPFKLEVANCVRTNRLARVYRSAFARGVDRLLLGATAWIESRPAGRGLCRWLTVRLQDCRWGSVG